MINEEEFKNICINELKEAIKYSDSRKIWIYGAGCGGRILKQVCDELEIVIEGFIDRKYHKKAVINGKMRARIIDVSPQNDYLLISLREYDPNIVTDLFDNGFSIKDMYYFAAGNDFLKEDTQYRGCTIGHHTYGYENLLEFYPIAQKIGRYCSINMTSRIWINHPTEYISTHPILDHPVFNTWGEYILKNDRCLTYGKNFNNSNFENSYIRKNEPVIIGNDVWIGANVVILPGVTINDGAILAAGAVVAHDVEPYTVVGGVPARPLKKRFNDEQIEILLRVKWWNWTEQEFKKNEELLYNTNKFFEVFQ